MGFWKDFIDVEGVLEVELEREGSYFFRKGKEGMLSLGAPVRLKLRLERKRNGVKVEGYISTEIELTCSRCLRTFRKTVHEPVDVFFSEGGVNTEAEGEEVELKESELNVEFIEPGAPINLKALVEEELRLLVPLKPLCHPECKGIDAIPDRKSGAEEIENINPRLLPLLELKKKLAGGNK